MGFADLIHSEMVIAVSHVDTALLIGIGATNAVTIKRRVTKTKILFKGMKYPLILLLSIIIPDDI